jgi:peptide subunit release factor 1 (eRF1)
LRKKFANSGLRRLVLLAADIEAKVQRVDEADAVEEAVEDAVEDAGDAVETETSKNDVVFAVAALVI